jgi:AcrR family transcriptional regulator
MSSDKPDTRIRILQSAWKLLQNSTGGEVRMSDIAKEAGISRQALYLHFPNRAELLVATTLYIDNVKNVDARLAASRAAQNGSERLDAFIDAWGNYIPEIYGIAKALMAMSATDQEAELAWNDRMRAVREGCEAAINLLAQENQLNSSLSIEHATDVLLMLLSVRNWEQLVNECGWTQDQYVNEIKEIAHRALVSS